MSHWRNWSEKKGGTRRVGDVDPQHYCRDPEHRPPSHMVFRPGVYEHECPTCGKITRFTINPPTLSTGPRGCRTQYHVCHLTPPHAGQDHLGKDETGMGFRWQE